MSEQPGQLRWNSDEQQSGPYLWEIYRFLAAHAQIGTISAQARATDAIAGGMR